MPTIHTGEPLLLDRIEIANMHARWPDAPNWPDEVHTSQWHAATVPAVGDSVLLFVRAPLPSGGDGWQLRWLWAPVREVGRWVLVVELPDDLPGTGVAAGDRIEVDPDDHVHYVRVAA